MGSTPIFPQYDLQYFSSIYYPGYGSKTEHFVVIETWIRTKQGRKWYLNKVRTEYVADPEKATEIQAREEATKRFIHLAYTWLIAGKIPPKPQNYLHNGVPTFPLSQHQCSELERLTSFSGPALARG